MKGQYYRVEVDMQQVQIMVICQIIVQAWCCQVHFTRKESMGLHDFFQNASSDVAVPFTSTTFRLLEDFIFIYILNSFSTFCQASLGSLLWQPNLWMQRTPPACEQVQEDTGFHWNGLFLL